MLLFSPVAFVRYLSPSFFLPSVETASPADSVVEQGPFLLSELAPLASLCGEIFEGILMNGL